jgi:tetratricopeptide (TPR) repeat protein
MKRSMTTLLFRGSILAAAFAALMITSAAAGAQGAPAAPPKHSFSNGDRTSAASPALKARKPVSQEDLAEAVLGDTTQRMWIQADTHFHQGEYNHMINLGRIVVQGDPHNMEAFATSAYYLWSMGVDSTPEAKKLRNDEAVALLNDGITANPNTYYMYSEMGTYWWIQRKDPKTAIPYFEKAVKFDCPFGTWNSLANCYEKLEQWAKAVTAWEKATLYPNNPVARVRLKRVRERLPQPKSGQ